MTWNSRYRIAAWAIAIGASLFAFGPAAVILLSSFGESKQMAFPPSGFTLEWYSQAFHDLASVADVSTIAGIDSGGGPLLLSVEIGLCAALLGGLIGTLAAYAVERFRFPGRRIVLHLVELPVLFPSIAFGIALLLIVTWAGIGLTFGRLVFANTLIVLPFVFRNVSASIASMGATLEDASRVLGASPVRTFLRVTLPSIRPGLLAGCLLAFIIAFNEFTVVYFLYTAGTVPFSVWAYGKSEMGALNSLAAIATIILTLNIVLALVIRRFSRGHAKAV